MLRNACYLQSSSAEGPLRMLWNPQKHPQRIVIYSHPALRVPLRSSKASSTYCYLQSSSVEGPFEGLKGILNVLLFAVRSRSVDLYIKWPLEPKDQGHTSFNTTLLGQLPKGCTLLGSNSRAAFRSLRNARLSVFSRGYPKIVGSKSHGAAATAKNAYDCAKSLL